MFKYPQQLELGLKIFFSEQKPCSVEECAKKIKKQDLEGLLNKHVGEPILVIKHVVEEELKACHFIYSEYEDVLKCKYQMAIIKPGTIEFDDRKNAFILPTSNCVVNEYPEDYHYFTSSEVKNGWTDVFVEHCWLQGDGPITLSLFFDQIPKIDKLSLNETSRNTEFLIPEKKPKIMVLVGKDKVAEFFTTGEYPYIRKEKIEQICFVDFTYLNGLKALGQNLAEMIPEKYKELFIEKLERKIILYLHNVNLVSKINPSHYSTRYNWEEISITKNLTPEDLKFIHNIWERVKELNLERKILNSNPPKIEIKKYGFFHLDDFKVSPYPKILQSVETYLSYLKELKS